MANDLRTGLTVYLTGNGTWSDCVVDAMIATDERSAGCALRKAEADEAASKITGAYLTDSNAYGDPVELREVIRVQGPSIDYLPSAKRVQHVASHNAAQNNTDQTRNEG